MSDGYKTINALDYWTDEQKERLEELGWYELDKKDRTDKKFKELCKIIFN